MDNILIAACTIEELMQQTKTVLNILEKEDLFLKPEKCDFEKEQGRFIERFSHTVLPLT